MNETEELIQTRISAYGHGCAIIDFALDTTISHLDNDDSKKSFIFLFLGRNIIWTNSIQDIEGEQYAQRITIDWLDQDGYTDYGIVMKFLSAVCFLTDGHVLDVLFNTSGPFPGPRCSHKTRFSCLNGYAIDLLIKSVDWSKLSDKDWSKIAYYRQGINSRSSYMAFLSFWNILEVHFNRKGEEIKKFINKEINEWQNFSEWKMRNGLDYYKELREIRNRSAHVLLNDDPDSPMQNPDNPIEYMEMNENKLIIRLLGEKIINFCLYKK